MIYVLRDSLVSTMHQGLTGVWSIFLTRNRHPRWGNASFTNADSTGTVSLARKSAAFYSNFHPLCHYTDTHSISFQQRSECTLLTGVCVGLFPSQDLSIIPIKEWYVCQPEGISRYPSIDGWYWISHLLMQSGALSTIPVDTIHSNRLQQGQPDCCFLSATVWTGLKRKLLDTNISTTY